MTKREYQRLVRKAALAYNLGSDDYTRIIDKAIQEVDDWDKFLTDLDEAVKTPPTDRQKAKHTRQEIAKEIEAAKRNLAAAQRHLQDLLKG